MVVTPSSDLITTAQASHSTTHTAGKTALLFKKGLRPKSSHIMANWGILQIESNYTTSPGNHIERKQYTFNQKTGSTVPRKLLWDTTRFSPQVGDDRWQHEEEDDNAGMTGCWLNHPASHSGSQERRNARASDASQQSELAVSSEEKDPKEDEEDERPRS